MKLRKVIAGFLTTMAISFSAAALPFTFESNGLPSQDIVLDWGGPPLFGVGAAINVQLSSRDSTSGAAVESDSLEYLIPERSSFALVTLGLAGLGIGGSRRETGVERQRSRRIFASRRRPMIETHTITLSPANVAKATS